MARTDFRDWLSGELQRQDMSRRELAKRLAATHPSGVTRSTVETYRRAVNRYLQAGDPSVPTEQTQHAIADALGVDRASLPEEEDEEEDLQLALLLRACRVKSRRRQLPPELDAWLRWGIRNGVFNEFARKEMAA